ncbi:putative gamma-glutamylcyclotransferase CG2811 isoform X2 [Lycorma delicatula]|uniref:putative gamma-glutamylcyclotransferase CG2811 isoform X2 n=1 Tax=Lycorma delicatula TaxID=130591 RepID=UPI003F5195E8
MSLKSLVFVYGTLKHGQPNHNWLTETENGCSKYVGDGSTVKKYPLIIASKYNIPFLLSEPGVGNNVLGEIYEIDEKMLGKLDILEEHPNYYIRRIEPIQMNAENNIIECWTYFLKEHKVELLTRQMFTSYDSKGDHGLVYCESLDNQSSIDDVLH